ncbi:Inner membrane ABC transporter permease protein yejE,oligopeptide ABC transporter permease OppC,ABC-type antimicrobial peptide transport system, permease component,nickel ABC transporter, permease subunit NikC,Binding-protein-dependent transport system inner membrane component [Chlamydia poikilotherma]|uniref:ABC transmembrane type-1 domain-containing protein n=1 Tax=Chlamydia poikilotherma TaxID=1967783 RepID=A0A3B0PUN7_9CHLA|nr:ABC transporter permease [Chlamydia poikilotherma]SYX08636.1 Inner membrane ABC transporter permease protein yejE,oligopeptide ABC transporter permease OppC,ABC-type antimicrobial peptide transport system, permease component,nickel ABC transporter, permease subunit NikC,Binding-protein-dependent transport system inner membrane component [Chlamydia poikilotherma]
MQSHTSFYRRFFQAYHKNFLASLSWKFVIVLSLLGIYAPLFASSKPILVKWEGSLFFPLFRYLWFPGFYTKPIDLFFNVLMITLPFFFIGCKFSKGILRKGILGILAIIQILGFVFVYRGNIQDPSGDENLKKLRAEKILSQIANSRVETVVLLPKDMRTWELEKTYMSKYEQLGILIKSKYRKLQHEKLQKYCVSYEGYKGSPMPTLHHSQIKNERVCLERLQKRLQNLSASYESSLQTWYRAIDEYRPFLMALTRVEHDLNLALYNKDQHESLLSAYSSIEEEAEPFRKHLIKTRQVLEEYSKIYSAINFIQDKRAWINEESEKLRILINPLLTTFHWEDDAGGSREMNKYVRWWQLTRINRKDLLASLIFGIRIALVVGGISVAIALFIGTVLGLISGYFGGTTDMVLSRFTEIWETMPMLFILMLVVSITQQKSLILDTILLGCFGWTGFSRYIRIETLKQRNMSYVLAATNMCYSHYHIMVHQILPNAIVPIISLLPFSMMAMISCEAGLTFLGLGEESSASWGNLMKEGVTAFPSESAILWPPAIMLTALLIAIALIGDGIRDALDPKLQD